MKNNGSVLLTSTSKGIRNSSILECVSKLANFVFAVSAGSNSIYILHLAGILISS